MTDIEEHPSFTLAKELPEPWRSHFPKSREEALAWEAHTRYRALASRVLVVAKTRVECAWAAYCDAVRGMRHDGEWQEVLRTGTKLDEVTARALFPRFDGVPYAE